MYLRSLATWRWPWMDRTGITPKCEQAGRSVQDINMLMYALVLHCVQLHGGGYRWVRQSQTLCQYIQTYCTAVW